MRRCDHATMRPSLRETVVENGDILLSAVPEADHIGLGGAGDGDEALRALGEEGQHVRKVEHPRARILARDVEVRQVVHRRRRRERIPGARAAVGRADHEPVELLPVPPDPKRQDEQVPEHRRHRAPRPARGAPDAGAVRAERRGLDIRLEDERELVPLRSQRPHDLPRIHGEAALAAVEGNAGDEKSHGGKCIKNRRVRQGEWFCSTRFVRVQE